MVAKVQFKVVSVLGDKRARRCRTLQDPLRANVSPYMVVEQLLSTTPATLAEFLHTLLKTTTNTTAAPTPGQSWTRVNFFVTRPHPARMYDGKQLPDFLNPK